MRFALLVAILVSLVGGALGTAVRAQEDQLIEGVEVTGNDYIPKEGILDEVKDILKPGEAFTAQRAKAAADALLAMGYFDDAQVTTRASAKGVLVVITVVEKQRIQRVLFVGNTVVSDTALSEAIYSKVGHVYDDRTVRRDARRIEDFYGQKGYIARIAQAPFGQFGVLTFVIEESRVEDILVKGLTRTREQVVRRELTIKPGALFDERQISIDRQKLLNLQLFKSVSFDPQLGVKDPQRGVIVVIVIEEKRTGSASVAAGYSNVDNFVLSLSLSESNFRGRGERTAVSLELFGRTSFEVSFFEPYVDKRGTSFSVRVYDTQRTRQFVGGAPVTAADNRFQERRTGATVALSRPLSTSARGSLRFRSEQISSSESQGIRYLGPVMLTQSVGKGRVGTAQTSTLPGNIINQPGTNPPDNPNLDPDTPEPGDVLGPVIVAAPLHPGGRLNSVTLGWVGDTRDAIADPTRGSMATLNWEEAGGPFGGEVAFRKLNTEYRRYRKMSRGRILGHPDVFAARIMLGHSLGALPLFESYSVGGGNTLRGYQEDRFRGERMVLLQTEYRRPITENLTAVLFVDVGDAYGGAFATAVPGFTIPAEDQSLKSHVGYGFGLRVQTPVGPIRLDFGWGEEGNQTHFNFGHTF